MVETIYQKADVVSVKQIEFLASLPAIQSAIRIGRIQGGIMCTLLDAVLGYAGLYVAPGESPLKNVTLSITTNFLNSAEGSVLTAKGFIERKGQGIYFARGEVWLDSSTLLATGVGTFKYVR